MATLTLADCRDEIERLHEFFVAWYTGETGDFEPMAAAIGSDFEMVSPDGDRIGQEAVLEMVRETHDAYDPGEFDIDIRNVEMVDAGDGYAVPRYEEWQTTPEGENGRLSTALFHTDTEAPAGLSWVTVHETWVEREDEN
ncbi:MULTISPECIES: hypothetical protein [Salinibaculum]|uniref:hypothetical protein n=1 Tax=Salinibaculum TaxID=2732368 RepID=UPI0030D3F9AB